MTNGQLRIGVPVVAYNAASTLAGVLDRIPEDFRRRIAEVIVADDASTDATYLVGLGYRQLVPDLPFTVVRNERNLGYGGNENLGYSSRSTTGWTSSCSSTVTGSMPPSSCRRWSRR
jgi:glycosyltransferase involved in cell wall biosynthesis